MSASILYGGVEYGKPNMAALEGDWGRRIMEQIARTPRLDYERLHEESEELKARILKEKADGSY